MESVISPKRVSFGSMVETFVFDADVKKPVSNGNHSDVTITSFPYDFEELDSGYHGDVWPTFRPYFNDADVNDLPGVHKDHWVRPTPVRMVYSSSSLDSVFEPPDRPNPFTLDGDLRKKADWILTHSVVTKSKILILDPDVPSSNFNSDAAVENKKADQLTGDVFQNKVHRPRLASQGSALSRHSSVLDDIVEEEFYQTDNSNYHYKYNDNFRQHQHAQQNPQNHRLPDQHKNYDNESRKDFFQKPDMDKDNDNMKTFPNVNDVVVVENTRKRHVQNHNFEQINPDPSKINANHELNDSNLHHHDVYRDQLNYDCNNNLKVIDDTNLEKNHSNIIFCNDNNITADKNFNNTFASHNFLPKAYNYSDYKHTDSEDANNRETYTDSDARNGNRSHISAKDYSLRHLFSPSSTSRPAEPDHKYSEQESEDNLSNEIQHSSGTPLRQSWPSNNKDESNSEIRPPTEKNAQCIISSSSLVRALVEEVGTGDDILEAEVGFEAAYKNSLFETYGSNYYHVSTKPWNLVRLDKSPRSVQRFFKIEDNSATGPAELSQNLVETSFALTTNLSTIHLQSTTRNFPDENVLFNSAPPFEKDAIRTLIAQSPGLHQPYLNSQISSENKQTFVTTANEEKPHRNSAQYNDHSVYVTSSENPANTSNNFLQTSSKSKQVLNFVETSTNRPKTIKIRNKTKESYTQNLSTIVESSYDDRTGDRTFSGNLKLDQVSGDGNSRQSHGGDQSAITSIEEDRQNDSLRESREKPVEPTENLNRSYYERICQRCTIQ